MPEVGFKIVIPALERAKTIQVLDCAVNMIRTKIIEIEQ
jgi:hypothetical protein